MLTVLLLASWAGAAFAADDTAKVKPTSPAFEALKKEFEEAQKKWVEQMRENQKAAQKALAEAKTDEEKKEAQKKMAVRMDDNPGAKFAPRFIELAAKNPKDPMASEAIVMAMRTGGGPFAKSDTWAKCIEFCRTNLVTNPDVKRVVRMLSQTTDEASEKLLKEVLAKNPERKVQALALKAMAESRNSSSQMAQRMKDNEAFRKRFEEQMGKDRVEKMIANIDAAKKESEELMAQFKEKYSDVFPDLSIGKPAPEVVIQDIDGKEAKLSATKGKVVVVDIWATWCGPCRQMIPHEREMVERLKDKPFALISVSADDEKKTLTDFLEKEKMPWTHWWNGAEGGILEDWDVQYFPTIYVIDAKGIIRHKDLRGEKLEEAVNELLKEASPN